MTKRIKTNKKKEDERANYVLRNPVGTVFYLEELTEVEQIRLPELNGIATPKSETPKELTPEEINALPHAEWVKALQTKGYVMATDAYVIIPDTIRGEQLTDYFWMFGSGSSPTIKGVASKNASITSMKFMFHQSPSTTLDVTHLDTSSVVDMWSMFNLAGWGPTGTRPIRPTSFIIFGIFSGGRHIINSKAIERLLPSFEHCWHFPRFSGIGHGIRHFSSFFLEKIWNSLWRPA